jgi:hypothetical protein
MPSFIYVVIWRGFYLASLDARATTARLDKALRFDREAASIVARAVGGRVAEIEA